MDKQEKYSVEVTDSGVSVVMHPEKEQKLSPQNFEAAPVSVQSAGDVCFYGAFNEQGVMERSVTSHIGDRKVVAALVGNWVAEGYSVERMTRKEMVKQLRKIEAAAKEEADRAIIQAAGAPEAGQPASTPSAPVVAVADTGVTAAVPVATAAANDAAAQVQPPAAGIEAGAREEAQAAYLAGQGGAESPASTGDSSNHNLPI